MYHTTLSFTVHDFSYRLGLRGLVDCHAKVWPPQAFEV
jgi:hypothetical protein